MTDFAVSNDGTRIAFDRLGEGPPVVLSSGIFCTRTTTQALAEELAQRFSVINYDRRGRGESTDTAPYAVEREIEDLGALIAEAGGAASVYGHSSGAGLALNGAAAGLPIERLILHEPPYGPDDGERRRGTAIRISDLLADGEYALLEGQDHGAPAEVVGPVVAEFLSR